jgi:hypothetical protein
MVHDVFISYVASDRKAADAACAILEKNKVRCWVAPRDIAPGATWGKAIVEAISDSRLMVLVFSSRSNKSDQVVREVERAVHRGIPILPLRIEDVLPSGDMEYFLSARHWLDAFPPPLESHMERLASAVKNLLSAGTSGLEGPEARPSVPIEGQSPTRLDAATPAEEDLVSAGGSHAWETGVGLAASTDASDRTADRVTPPCLTDSATLRWIGQGRPTQTVLVAKDRVSLGVRRGATNDIVVRLLPRSHCGQVRKGGCGRPFCTDCQTKRISRKHCTVTLTDKAVTVADCRSHNGTTLGGHMVPTEGRVLGKGVRDLVLGGTLHLTAWAVEARTWPIDGSPCEGAWEAPGPLWDTAGAAGVDAVVLERLNNLGPKDPMGFESYCLVYRLATVGSGQHCAIRVKDQGLEPAHAAILYGAGRFYLQNLCGQADVRVADAAVEQGRWVGLRFGDRITIGRLQVDFMEKEQLFLD